MIPVTKSVLPDKEKIQNLYLIAYTKAGCLLIWHLTARA